MSGLAEVLGRALMDLERHQWKGRASAEDQWASLAPHYQRDAERFLVGPVVALVEAAVRLLEPDDITPTGARQIRRVLEGDQ